ncbi:MULTISPECIES: DUF4097 family beta strand repeat-containing protein [Streptomyces]|uniref:DUF4097 family beta strand repeat-containing protein n=1 Tax=Streptomyces solicathayae TaxID=3081768 RepID=A0ABZ0LNG9_9ACTN|nr:DUF4097 family beta strand repeat-containing protein [Streptomyces sp. HUAS YS2]WOX20902.1 DUF4097 family beta strand repeat-containing protein [Streptomyces sp. HUAS YS2]
MPSYDTPEPITAVLEFDIGTARIVAGKQSTTVVEVVPSNGAEEIDVKAAEQTKVTYANGTLTLKGPKKRSVFGKVGSIDVTVELPAGSHLQGNTPMADFTCEGPFADCRIKTSLGDIRLGDAETVNLRTSHGDIHVGRITGDAEIQGAGRIEVGEIQGDATVKNGNGDTEIGLIRGDATVKNGNGHTEIGEITGRLRANAANGRITVDVAHASAEVKSANGAIRIGEVFRGRIDLRTAVGDIEVGIRESTAAWLDLHTKAGRVENSLGASTGPGGSDETVEVHAHTSLGDIAVRRA